MKRWVMVMLLAATTGCSGIVMSSKYSALLDKYVTLAQADATMAINKTMDPNDMRAALLDQYGMFKVLQDARDGRETDVSDLERTVTNPTAPR